MQDAKHEAQDAPRQHLVREGLSEAARQRMIALLNARLADAIDLRLALKQAFWNVKGPGLVALQDLLDGLQARVDAFADDIAGLSAARGGVAVGTTQAAAQTTALDAYPIDISADRDHLEALAARVAAFVLLTRAAVDAADGDGDADAAGLFADVSRQMGHCLAALETHLQ